MRKLALVANYVVSLLIGIAIVIPIGLVSRCLLARLHSPLAEIVIFAAWFLLLLLFTAVRRHDWRAMYAKKSMGSSLWLMLILTALYLFMRRCSHYFSPEFFFTYLLPLYILMGEKRLEPLFSWGRQTSLLDLLNTGECAPLRKALDSLPGESLNKPFSRTDTPLIHAILLHGKPEIISLLLEHGADPNLPSAAGMLPIQVAVMLDRYEAVELLLRHGASTEPAKRLPTTLLHLACLRGRKTALVELLLRAGCDINGLNRKGETPLHIAARRGEVEILKLLLAHGAEVNARDQRGATPLALADEQVHGLKRLFAPAGRRQVVEILRTASAAG